MTNQPVLPGFESWMLNDYPYTAAGWLITKAGPWKPGESERVVASSQSWEIGLHIVADHNSHAVEGGGG